MKTIKHATEFKTAEWEIAKENRAAVVYTPRLSWLGELQEPENPEPCEICGGYHDPLPKHKWEF
jgi:hypothetical protein